MQAHIGDSSVGNGMEQDQGADAGDAGSVETQCGDVEGGCTDAQRCCEFADGPRCVSGSTCPSLARDDAGAPDEASSPEVACAGDTVEEVCAQFCEALCQNQERFCSASECNADACSAVGEVAGPCVDQCGSSGAAAIACARNLCMDQLAEERSCESFGLEANGEYVSLCLESDPLCVPAPAIGCSNTCGSRDGVGGDLATNNRCEDGHDEDSVASTCPRGTDCADCGRHPCVAAGGQCSSHGDCCGFFADGALCVDPDGSAGAEAPFCIVTCSDEGECADGFRCVATDGADSVCLAL